MPHLEISPLIGCKVQCDFCPQSLLMNRYKEKENIDEITFGKPVLMTFEIFKKCIDKVPINVDIHFSGFTEAWLNPECTKMLLYAYNKGHRINVFTTMVSMSTNDIEIFKHIPFQKFQVHLADTQKIAKIVVNNHYLEVLKKLVSSKIHHLSFMSMGDVPKVIQKTVGINFPPNFMHDRAGNCENGTITLRKSGPLVCSKANSNGKNTLDQNVLLPNGDVCLCCMDYGMEYVIGNLLEMDYYSLFETDRFKEIQEKISSEDSDIMCRTCSASIQAEKYVHRMRPTIRPPDDKYTQTIKEIYDEMLLREPEIETLGYFHSLLERKEISITDLKKRISESNEFKSIHKPLITTNIQN